MDDKKLKNLNIKFGLDDINAEEKTKKTVRVNVRPVQKQDSSTKKGLSSRTEFLQNAPKKTTETEEDRTDILDIYDVLQCVFVAIVTGILIFLLAGRVVGVEGSSMFPTLHDGDRLIVSNILFEPSCGDIVILKSESYDHALVKRIIATEGQTIDIDFENGVVYVDNKTVYEPYIYEKTYTSEGFEGPVTVPDGCVFVMGDNRNDSSDSRRASIGFIDERQIIGKAYLLIFPGRDYDDTRDWSRIGSVY